MTVEYKCAECGHEPKDGKGLVAGPYARLRCRDCFEKVERPRLGLFGILDDPLGQQPRPGANPR